MLEYDDSRAVSRSAADAPVTPPPVWERRGISERDYDAIRADKRAQLHAKIEADSRAAISAALDRITQYQATIRNNRADMPLMLHYANRIRLLRNTATSLATELKLVADNIIQPYKAMIYWTGVIRSLLNTPIEMPASKIRVLSYDEYKRELRRSRAMRPAEYKPFQNKILPHYPTTDPSATPGAIAAKFRAAEAAAEAEYKARPEIQKLAAK